MLFPNNLGAKVMARSSHICKKMYQPGNRYLHPSLQDDAQKKPLCLVMGMHWQEIEQEAEA